MMRDMPVGCVVERKTLASEEWRFRVCGCVVPMNVHFCGDGIQQCVVGVGWCGMVTNMCYVLW